MSDNDIFNTDKDDKTPLTPPAVKVPDDTPPSDDLLLGMIVNSDGEQKYKTRDDALKGAAHANVHIAKLEQELLALRDAHDKQPKLDDVISAIQSQQKPPVVDEKTDNISLTDIQALVNQTLEQNSVKQIRELNVAEVTGKFKELYGDKASETLYGKANDLGMSQEEINSLISTNPTAVFRMLGVAETKPTAKATIDGSVNPQVFDGVKPPEIKSSMGYLSSDQLKTNWLESKARTYEKLGLTG